MARSLTSTPRRDGFRMPGEFEPHIGCWMLWPERSDNWRSGARPAQRAFAAVATAIAEGEPVTVCVSRAPYSVARRLLPESIRLVEMSSNEQSGCRIARDAGNLVTCTDVTYHRAFERRRVMILGMSTATFTAIHVIISLIGIVAGVIVLVGMLSARRLPGWTALFLVTTVLTSVTGFLFPAAHVLPSHIVGVISLVVLAITMVALYVRRLAGSWRWIYVTGAVLALYLNVFVGVVQAFQRVPVLSRLAPTQSEPPFLVAQLMVMAIFVVLGILAVVKFRPVVPRPV